MKNIKNIFTVLLLSVGGQSGTVIAEEKHPGESLHNNHCTACHTKIMNGQANNIYTRKDRRVNDFEGLFRQVNRCNANLGLDWPQKTTDEVVNFLNQKFYKFDF